MITLSYKEVYGNMFQHSLRKLNSFPSLPIKTAYWVNRITDKIQSEVNSSRTVILSKLKSCCKTNEDGSLFLADPKDPASYEFKSDEAKAEFEKQESEFLTGHFEIPFDKISLEQLDQAGFKASAAEIQALLPIIQAASLEVVKG